MKIYEKKIFLDPFAVETKNYLFSSAKNKIKDYFKKTYREKIKLREYTAKEALIDRYFFKGLDKMYLHGEILSTLHDTIDNYDRIKGEIFITRFFGGKTNKILSRNYGMSAYRVKKVELEIADRIRENIMNIDPEFFS